MFAMLQVIVIPSLKETFGKAALEAMACGKPLVTSDAGNLPALVEDGAFVVPKGSAHELANAITRVLQEPDLRVKLAERGPLIAQRYSNKAIARLLMNLMAFS